MKKIASGPSSLSITPMKYLSSFHPEMVFLPNLYVNLRSCLCDVLQYVSAQALVFLDLEQKSSFPISKLRCAHPAFPDGHSLHISGRIKNDNQLGPF